MNGRVKEMSTRQLEKRQRHHRGAKLIVAAVSIGFGSWGERARACQDACADQVLVEEGGGPPRQDQLGIWTRRRKTASGNG
jgi:hypothetical protein